MSCSLTRNRVQRTSLNVYDPDIFNCSRQGRMWLRADSTDAVAVHYNLPKIVGN
jgi:hypothetical protein